jgi:hypothetical protein
MATAKIWESSSQKISIRITSQIRAELNTIQEAMFCFEKNQNPKALIDSIPDGNKNLIGLIAKMLFGEKFKVREAIVHGISGIHHFNVDISLEKESLIVPDERSLGPADLPVATGDPYEFEH